MLTSNPTPPSAAADIAAWLTVWVATTAGVSPEEIDADAPMQNLGLSSRDVVVLSGELENRYDVRLDATVAYQYPTINALASFIAGGATAGRKCPPTVTGRVAASGRPEDHDIAIVGMAARFPGAEDKDSYWDELVAGRSGVGPLPEGRWSEYSGDRVVAHKIETTNTTGGYLKDIAGFDAEYFGLSPVEAANMDPQQRIVLELAVRALEDARIPADRLKGSRTGVWIGSTNNDYGMLIAADPDKAHPYALTGTASSIIANRVSYVFDLRGPSVAVDTACSSSLVAIDQAVRALRDGQADVALAGGVNILASPFVSTAFGELGVLSPTGKIHAFSADADGFVRGDGAGIVVLKRVADALADGDDIVAVIRGSAVNSDGKSNGITAPNPEAQKDVLKAALADAGMGPGDIDYVEAHGTGTILGDPIEASSIGAVYGACRPVENPVLVGSAKTNIGHTEAAAGVAGLIKVALGLGHGIIPPSLNYTEPNPYIDIDALHLEVVEDPREWPAYSGTPTAGVSAFGFGGTNAHAIVSAFDPDAYETAEKHIPAELNDGPSQVLVPISGLLPSRRRAAAGALADWLESQPADVDMAAVARALARTTHGRAAAVVTAADKDEAVKRLRYVAAGKSAQGIVTADQPKKRGPVFVYSGFGSQHRKMAKELYGLSPLFKKRIDELNEIIVFESGWSLVELIGDDSQTYDTETAQVGITAIQIALTDLLAHFNIRPAAITAMSMGEIAAAYAGGGLDAADAMRVACHRSRLMGQGEKSLSEDQLGAMAVVEFSADELASFIDEHPEYAKVEAAVYAGPGMTTVGGPREQVVALTKYCEDEKKFARLLNVKGAGHTSAVDPLLGELAAETADIAPKPITVPLYSSVDKGVVYEPGAVIHDTDYWLRCTRGRVFFLDATTKAFADGYDCFVEICPNPVALMGLMSTAFACGKPDAQLLCTLKRKQPAAQTLGSVISTLYVDGAPVDLRPILGDGKLVRTPGVTMKKEPHWTAARPSSSSTPGLPGNKVQLPDNSLAFSTLAEHVPSTVALVEAAADKVVAGATVTAVQEHATLPASGEITTVARKTIGGVTVSVYRIDGESTVMLAEGFAVTTGGGNVDVSGGLKATAAASDPADTGLPEVNLDAAVWDPSSGQTVEQRLKAIVSESMGYEIDDLPGDLPLIDLGLDSLMGMRIRNRVEHDFQLERLDVQALRDASVSDVVDLVTRLVADRKAEPTASGAGSADPAGDDAPAAKDDATTTAHTDKKDSTQADSASQLETKARVGVGVAPRDASERLVFGTWAKITGKAPAGVTSELDAIDEKTAQAIADRLAERSGATVTIKDVAGAKTLEPLSDLVRTSLETDVEGNIRVLRARPEGSTKPAVFMFHPAGGSSVVYQPLTRRLPKDQPVYGVERREGTLEERAAAYIDDIVSLADGRDIVLGGWSFGGALAYEVAHQLVGTTTNVALIALLDTVQPSTPIPDTPEETLARWKRYSAFAKKTYNLDFEVPTELLQTAGEDGLLDMMGQLLSTTDPTQHGLSAGVLEHQRASFVDNRILARMDLRRWEDVSAPVILFRAERMHDGAIELEPRYADIDPDGGWSAIVSDLEIVKLHGDHLAVVDEPEISTVARHLARRIDEL